METGRRKISWQRDRRRVVAQRLISPLLLIVTPEATYIKPMNYVPSQNFPPHTYYANAPVLLTEPVPFGNSS
ncbi:hypothetical protein CEXT_96881 [Caerostris extrusa]|uniref:Uncharacterized protein n=1 Tax=Caerostris extrusa TaxID=172846 RepID=A0AAV4NRD9_CAEEX|nr:hypothetical protein CEXT_96881 [Caerostris extrusa]